MKTYHQPIMFRIGSNNEFDIYFARAALEEMENGTVESRRGSLPVAPPNQLIIQTEVPRRTHSCKYPSRERRKGGSVSPRERDGTPSRPIQEDSGVHSPPEQQAQNDEVHDVHISVPMELPQMDHTRLAPGPHLDFKCHSAPHSRSSSWRKDKRPHNDRYTPNNNDKRRDSVPLEDSITSRLEQLRILQADDCCVVRNFVTSSRGGLINRGDSFKRKSFSVASDAESNGSGLCEADRSISVHSIGGSTAGSSGDQPIFRVLLIGAHGVGKTALIQQFLTSEYMGALETSFGRLRKPTGNGEDVFSTDMAYETRGEIGQILCDVITRQSIPNSYDDSERTVSVLLDGEETMIDMFDIPPDRDYKLYENVDAYVIIYSKTDRASFAHAVDLMEEVMCDRERHPAVILVANKSDLVRTRQIASDEGRELCLKHDCKYIEVSAVLNHKVDDLLVGIISQIRLHPHRLEKRKRKSIDEVERETKTKCSSGPRGLLQKLFKRQPFVSKSCDNLLVL